MQHRGLNEQKRTNRSVGGGPQIKVGEEAMCGTSIEYIDGEVRREGKDFFTDSLIVRDEE